MCTLLGAKEGSERIVRKQEKDTKEDTRKDIRKNTKEGHKGRTQMKDTRKDTKETKEGHKGKRDHHVRFTNRFPLSFQHSL